MADQNNSNRSGFPPNLNMNLGGQQQGGGGGGFPQGGDQSALWAQLAAQQKQNGGGQGFNPTDSSHRLQQNANGQAGSPQQQQASLMLQKALQQQARAGAGQGGAQLQMPSGQGQVGIAGQHALLQALLASNQHQQGNNQQQQQFGNGMPQQQFNGNQNQFNLQLPNQQQHHNAQMQQQQQHLQQQQQQQPNSTQLRTIPQGIQQMLAQMGAQGNNMLNDWKQGNMTGEQMVQLKQLIAAHQARQPKPNADLSQQQQQQQSGNQHNQGHERNASGSSSQPTLQQQQQQQKQQQQQNSIAGMTNEQLQGVISQLGARLKTMESSLQLGTVPPETVERARSAIAEWGQQLRGLVREAQSRNLNVGNLIGNNNANIHASPNPPYGAIPPNSQANQFSQNANTFNASPSLGARPTPQSFNQNLPTSSPSMGSAEATQAQRSNFFGKLAQLWKAKGIKIDKTPSVEGRNIDLYDLYERVTKEGGSETVRNQNLWPVMGAQLGLNATTGMDGVARSTPDAANQVADIFVTFLSSFEDAWRQASEDRRRRVAQSPQLNQQQNPQFNGNNNNNQQQSQSSQQGQMPTEFNDAVLERLSQVPPEQRANLHIPAEVSRRLEVYVAQKTLNASNNVHSSPHVQAGLVGQQQQQQNATIAWTKQQQQYAEASQRLASANGGTALGQGTVPPRTTSAAGGQDGGQQRLPFKPPTQEESTKSKAEVQNMTSRVVEKLRSDGKTIDGLSDEQKSEITSALRDLQAQVADAEKRLILFRILSTTPEAIQSCNRAVHMIAMWTHASQQASQGRFVNSRQDLHSLGISIQRFIAFVHTAVQAIISRPPPTEQARMQMQQQQLHQQQAQAAQALQQQQLQNQQQNQQPSASTSAIPDPSSFAPTGRLRAEDLRAPPPPKRARTSSVGGIASPSPAATTPAELKTPINTEQSPPATGKSPASGKKGSTPKDSKASGSAAAKREKLSRKTSTGGASRSTLDQVKEEKRDGDSQPSVQEETTLSTMGLGVGGPTDPASVLGLQMDGWEERRRQEEVRAAQKDPVSFFQAQWNNLQQAQMNAVNGAGNQMLQQDGNTMANGVDHTALARAMRDIRQPSSFGSSSSSYPPIASSSSHPYHHMGYGSLQEQQQAPPSPEKPEVDDTFDISFFIDASQYEDEDEVANDEVVAPTEDDGGARVGLNSSTGTTDPRAPDAQTPDLLHSGGPHDESPASVKEAISPPRLLPFRSSTSTGDSNNLALPSTSNRGPNPFSRPAPSSSSTANPSAPGGDLSVSIPATGNDGSNSVSAKSISPLPLETPTVEGENGLEIWASEMGEDSYYGSGADFNWEGTGGGIDGGASWLINSS